MDRRKPILLYDYKLGCPFPQLSIGACVEIKICPSMKLITTKPILSLGAWGEFETCEAIYRPAEVMDHDS